MHQTLCPWTLQELTQSSFPSLPGSLQTCQLQAPSSCLASYANLHNSSCITEMPL